MKPLNKKERRKAFWKFTLLFFLAVVPICTAIYLYGRVDKAENAFLRKEFEARAHNAEIDGSTIDRGRLYTSLKASVAELKNYLISNDPNFVNNQLYGEISTKITPIDDNIQKFNKEIRSKGLASQADSVLYDLIILQIDNLIRLNSIYEDTSKKIREIEEELDDTEKDLENCEKKFL